MGIQAKTTWLKRLAQLCAASLVVGTLALGVPALAATGDPGSIEFDGASSLSYPSSENFSLTGDYTVELWTKFATNPRSGNHIISRWKSGSQEYALFATGGDQWANGSGGSDWKWVQKTTTGEVSVSFTRPSLNVWHHIAMVRSGNNITAYLDGVSVATGTFTGTVTSGINSPLEIGGLSNASGGYYDTNNFTGRISNVRISKSAIYTTGFTPSTTPLTSVNQTSLLLNMTQGADYSDSQNGSVATAVGTPLSNSDVPFALSVPVPPYQVRGTSNVGTTSTVSWIASPTISQQGSNTYTVVGSNDGVNFSEVSGCVDVSGTSCTATGLVLARGYVFKVRAKNLAGYSEYSLLEASTTSHFRPGNLTTCAELNVLGTSSCGIMSNIQPYTTAVMPVPTYCNKVNGVNMNDGRYQPDLGVFDADGNIFFVLENSVMKMAHDGIGLSQNCLATTFNSSGLLKSPNGKSIGMDAAGNIYVSNNDITDKSVIRISADGITAETYLTTQQTGSTINGIIFDSDQNLIGYQNISVGFGVYLVKFANVTKTKSSIISFSSNAIMPELGGNKTITGVSLNAFDDIMLSFHAGDYDYLAKFDHTFVQPEPAVCVGACTQNQINQNKENLIYDSTGTLWPSKYPPTVTFFAKFDYESYTQAAVVDSEGNTWAPQLGYKRMLKFDTAGKPVLSTGTGVWYDGDGVAQLPALKIDPAGNIWVKYTNGYWAWAKVPGATKPFLRQLRFKGIGSTPYRVGKTEQIQLDDASGAVAFKTTNIGNISVSSTGTLTASSALEPGKYSVSGTALDSANTSGTWTYTLTVTKAQPTVLLSSSSNPSRVRDTVTYTATPSVFDSGTVITFRDGVASIGTCTVTVVSCSITKSNFTAGSHSVTAETAESVHYLSATSTGINQVVGTLASSTTWSVSSAPTQGQTITLSATVTPTDVTGTVVFQDSNSNTLCTTGNLVNGAANCTWTGSPARGTYDVYATYSGDAEYAQSVGAHADVIIRSNQTALSMSSGSTVPYLSTLTLDVTGGSGAGAVTYAATQNSACAVSGNVLTPGPVGSMCQITATKAADGFYFSASTTPQTITVTKIDQTTALTFTNANTMTFGQELSLLATGGSGDGAISYAVTSAGLTGCTISGTTLSVTGAGTCSLSASRAMSTNFNATAVGSRATLSITVSKAAQVLSFTSAVPTTPIAGGSYSVTAESDSGLTPSFSIVSGNCSISGSTVSFSATGDCVVRARQMGNTQYLAASDITQTIAVGRRNQTLTFSSTTEAIAQKTYGDTAFIVEASSTESTAVLVYSVGPNTTNSACDVSGSGVVTVGHVGTCEVLVNAVGTTAFAAASQIAMMIPVVADLPNAPFLISTSAGNMSATVSFTVPTYIGGSAVTGYELTAVDQTFGSIATITESGCSPTAVGGFVTCTVRGLENGVNYKLKVAAVNAAGRGSFSALSDALTAATNPAAVQQLRVTEDNASLVVKWDDPDSLGGGTFSAYRVFIKKSSETNFDQLHYFNVADNTVHSATVTRESPNDGLGFAGGPLLENGISYDVKVVTVTTANAAELTSNTAVAFKVPRTVPSAPVLAEALNVSDTLVLSWDVPSTDGGSAIESYVVTFNGATCSPVNPTDTTCVVAKPTTPGDYVYRVTAKNTAGESLPATGRFTVPTPVVVTTTVAPTTSTTVAPTTTNVQPAVAVTTAPVVTSTTVAPRAITVAVTTTSTTSTTSTTVPASTTTTEPQDDVPDQSSSGFFGSAWSLVILLLLLIAAGIAYALYRRKKPRS